MKIREVAKQLNMTSRNIRFYEEEGLIHIGRGDNNYREYNETDIQRLREIKVLRDIGIPIIDIKAYFKKEKSLKDITAQRLSELQTQVHDTQLLYQICEMMNQNEIPLTSFTTQKYQEVINQRKNHHYGKLISEDWRLKLDKKTLLKTFCIILFPLLFLIIIILNFMGLLIQFPLENNPIPFYMIAILSTLFIDTIIVINTSIKHHMELREDGIYFMDKTSHISQFQLLKDVWHDDYVKDLEFIDYQDIIKVKVDYQEAGMITGGDVMFTFYFIVFTKDDEVYRFDSTLLSSTQKFITTLGILHDKSPQWIDPHKIYQLLQLPNEKLYPILNHNAWNKRQLQRHKRINQKTNH